MAGIEIAEVPAWVAVIVWIAVQAASAWSAPASVESVGAAALTTTAGAAAGALGGRLLLRPERMHIDWWDPPRRQP
jgi:hypothetical protein